MKVGDSVTINKCDQCAAVVGKVVKVKSVNDGVIQVNYGRGRPQANRPSTIPLSDVSLVDLCCESSSVQDA